MFVDELSFPGLGVSHAIAAAAEVPAAAPVPGADGLDGLDDGFGDFGEFEEATDAAATATAAAAAASSTITATVTIDDHEEEDMSAPSPTPLSAPAPALVPAKSIEEFTKMNFDTFAVDAGSNGAALAHLDASAPVAASPIDDHFAPGPLSVSVPAASTTPPAEPDNATSPMGFDALDQLVFEDNPDLHVVPEAPLAPLVPLVPPAEPLRGAFHGGSGKSMLGQPTADILDLFGAPSSSSSFSSSSSASAAGDDDAWAALDVPPGLGDDDLEALATALADRDYMEEAHCCLRKRAYLRDLWAARAAAPAERARKGLARRRPLVASAEDERRWAVLAAGGGRGEALEEMVDLIRAIDPVVGDACAEQLAAAMRRAGAGVAGGLDDRVRRSVAARRACRLVTAVCTTHTQHPRYWRQLLTRVSGMLQEASAALEQYRALPAADQSAAAADARLQALASAAARVAELGLWVAATCVEAVCVDRTLAAQGEQVAQHCTVFAVKMLSAWQLPTDAPFALPSVPELQEAAADHAAYAQACGGPAQVVYCGLTLRPLGTAVPGAAAPASVAYDHLAWKEHGNERFLRAAINVWTHDVSDQLPDSDGPF